MTITLVDALKQSQLEVYKYSTTSNYITFINITKSEKLSEYDVNVYNHDQFIRNINYNIIDIPLDNKPNDLFINPYTQLQPLTVIMSIKQNINQHLHST